MKKLRISLLPLLLAGAAAFWIYQTREYQSQIDAYRQERQQYGAAFGETLTQELQALELNLSKIPLSDEPEALIVTLSDARSRAQSAAQALSMLPADPESGQEAMAFLQRTQDYTRTLMKQASAGEPLCREDLELVNRIRDGCLMLEDASLTMDFTPAQEWENLPFPEPQEDEELYPVMIYDGPFSQEESDDPPVGLTGDAAGPGEALTVAAQLLNLPQTEITEEESIGGDLPGSVFSAGDRRVMISDIGLHPVWMLSASDGTDENLNEAQAEETAKRFCAQWGMDVPAVTWSQHYDGCMVFCLAPVQEGAILYPDLVKVKLSLMDGSVLGLDARRYLKSHCARDLPAVCIDEEQARSLAPALLEVETCRLAYIEPNGGNGALTWELCGTYRGEDFYVYLDAVSGDIVHILRRVDSPEGGVTQ